MATGFTAYLKNGLFATLTGKPGRVIVRADALADIDLVPGEEKVVRVLGKYVQGRISVKPVAAAFPKSARGAGSPAVDPDPR